MDFGLGVTFSPRDPRFTASNSAEVDGAKVLREGL